MFHLFFRLLLILSIGSMSACTPKAQALPTNTDKPKPDETEEPDPTPAVRPEKELVLLTYNVAALGHGGDQTDNVVRVIRDSQANLVSLNELDSTNNRHNVFQLRVLAEKLGDGWRYKFGKAMNWNGGGYGNGVLSDKALRDTVTLHLEKGRGQEPRSVAVVETEDVVFGAVHLDFSPQPLDQAKAMNAWFEERYAGYKKPVILCGDFNVEPGSETMNEVEKYWVRLSEPVKTWETPIPTLCLDYIFYLRSAVQVTATETAKVKTEAKLDATSDHFPVRVKIKF